jgi:hypothetical protein
MSLGKSKIIEAVLSESSNEDPSTIQVQDEYSRLSEKCDIVITKIKKRKQNKLQATK